MASRSRHCGAGGRIPCSSSTGARWRLKRSVFASPGRVCRSIRISPRSRTGWREGVHNPTFGTRVETLSVERVNRGAEVTADLASGRYLLIVAVQVDDEAASGEVFYDFNVVVE